MRGAWTVAGWAGLALGIPLLATQIWRNIDRRAADAAWDRLLDSIDPDVALFDPAMVDDLPDAARRFFLFTIAPGTPLRTVARIDMTGEIGLGDLEAPGYQPMWATQLLAPPHGLVWRLERAGSGPLRMSGSDGMVADRSWTRFWLLGTLPVVRAGGGPDHFRSALGRVVAEAVFWAPAALLPQHGVEWVPGRTPDRARAVVSHHGYTQELEITVADDGRPISVVIPRWSDANPEREWRMQPFGGYPSDFREFEGFMLPTQVEGGNHFGTNDYFPFFRARVERIHFPTASEVPTPSPRPDRP